MDKPFIRKDYSSVTATTEKALPLESDLEPA